jgi:hypothetical protein
MGWGSRRAGSGQKPGKNRRTVSLLPARAHRPTVEEMPLDILIAAARDPPDRASPGSGGKGGTVLTCEGVERPAQGVLRMTDTELEIAIACEKEHALRTNPGQHQIREVSRR